MKNGKHINSNVFCACYKYNTLQSVYCLGVPGSSANVTTFTNGDERKRFMKKHCYPQRESARCPIYGILFNLNRGGDDG